MHAECEAMQELKYTRKWMAASEMKGYSAEELQCSKTDDIDSLSSFVSWQYCHLPHPYMPLDWKIRKLQDETCAFYMYNLAITLLAFHIWNYNKT
jgi:hypothetical protein